MTKLAEHLAKNGDEKGLDMLSDIATKMHTVLIAAMAMKGEG